MPCSLRFCASTDLAPAAQAQLRVLSIAIQSEDEEAWTYLQVAGLLALPALESLHLSGYELVLGSEPAFWDPAPLPALQPAGGLPPSLTSLSLHGFVDGSDDGADLENVPLQVGAL